MPLYVYEIISERGENGEQFEVLQHFNDPPLTHHPDSGLPVRRVLTTASVAGRFTDFKAAGKLSDKNLEAKGFTKYVKAGNGRYEKRLGKGPNTLSADQS
jgi:predicted nucleic acid-binding Zn ribbon protein